MAIRALLFDADGQDREVDLGSRTLAGLGDRQLLWVDALGQERAGLDALIKQIGLPPDVAQSLVELDRRPRVDLFAETVAIVVTTLTQSGATESTGTLKLIVGRNVVVTIHPEPVDFLVDFEDRIKGDSRLGELDAPAFLGALLDWHLTSYFRIVDDLETTIDRLDARALEPRTGRGLLDDLIRFRRRIALVRRAITPHREVFSALARPDLTIIAEPDSAPQFRALEDRLERVIAAVENSRDLLIGSFDVYMTQTAQRTNQVMKVIALASVILLPASVLAGVMGMNFQATFFTNPDNFYVVVGVMLAVAVATLGLARLRGWI